MTCSVCGSPHHTHLYCYGTPMQQAIDQACDRGEVLCPICNPTSNLANEGLTEEERKTMDKAFWKSVEVLADGIEHEDGAAFSGPPLDPHEALQALSDAPPPDSAVQVTFTKVVTGLPMDEQ